MLLYIDGSLPGSHRDSFLQWYKQQLSWTCGTNYYVKTFIGEKHQKDNDI